MRTITAWMSAMTIMTTIYVVRHAGEINWHCYMEHYAYLFRGWKMEWLMQLRAFSTNEWLLIGGIALVAVWSARSINK